MDIDIAPKQIDFFDKPFEKRDVPLAAWDAFAANRLDRQNLRDHSFSVGYPGTLGDPTLLGFPRV